MADELSPTPEQREQAALMSALKEERDRGKDSAMQRIAELEKKVASIEPVFDRLKTLHGEHPMEVVGDTVTIDPSALKGGAGKTSEPFDCWRDGVLVIRNLVVD